MSQTERLPGMPPDPPIMVQRLPDGLSAGRRRTQRQKLLLAIGIHPATHLRLIDNGRTCGDCVHQLTKVQSGTWFKCELQLHNGVGLDIRKSWPACVRFDERKADKNE